MMTPGSQPSDLLDAYHDGRLTRRQFVERALVLGFSVSGAAGFLAGCHQGHKAAPKRLSGRVQILVGFDGGNTAVQRQVQQTLARAFIAAHPQVGIDFLRATSAPAAGSQLRALVSRGSPPDIVLGIGLAEISRFVDQHMWLDVRPLFNRDGPSNGAFLSQAIRAAAVPSYYGGTTAMAGVPVGIHDHALAYNVDLFSRAGLPAPPGSWTDSSWTFPVSFLQAAQALTVDSAGRHVGQPGFDLTKVSRFGTGRVRPETVFFSFGGHLYDSARRRTLLDTPTAIQGAQFAGDLVQRYHVQPSPTELALLGGTGGTGDDEQAAWRAGKLAMIDMCSCEIDSRFGSKVPFTWKSAALPAGPAGRSGVLDVSFGAIVAASAQHDLAWEVLRFLAIDPANERSLAYGGFGAMPALSANTAAFAQATTQSVGVDPAVWVAGVPSASVENDNWLPAFAEVHTLFSAALVQIAGGAGAATVMPQLQLQAQAKVDAWFKANKLPK